jgi:hypothetical protein
MALLYLAAPTVHLDEMLERVTEGWTGLRNLDWLPDLDWPLEC